jgi:NAD(P)-dependent dehydrogenase (short-subunit alcohol dehydrogenase family)
VKTPEDQRADRKVVLITGGGSGIGLASAMLFARQGAAVALVGRTASRLEAACEIIRRAGGIAMSVPADVTVECSVQQAVYDALRVFGRLDTVVTAAGVATRAARVGETTDESWDEVVATNLTGTFRTIRATLPHLVERRGGSIVTVASIAALVGMKDMAAYSAAKGGVVALTRVTAVEYGPAGVRANCVCPGTVHTPMTADYLAAPRRWTAAGAANPLLRVAQPDDIARAIIFLGSDDSRFVNGAVLTIDGGYTAQ